MNFRTICTFCLLCFLALVCCSLYADLDYSTSSFYQSESGEVWLYTPEFTNYVPFRLTLHDNHLYAETLQNFSDGTSSWDPVSSIIPPIENGIVANTLLYLYGNSNATIQAAIDAQLQIGGFVIESSLDSYPSAIAIPTEFMTDSDSDGMLNYQDPDYNTYIAVPEPETVLLLLAGMAIVLNRMELLSTVNAIAVSFISGLMVWSLFVRAKNEKRIW